jgi:Glycosyl transferase family 11
MRPMVYPSLPPSSRDFGVLRLSGAGLGNCFYAYFHAVVAAKEEDRQLIAPTWRSLKIGPWLRGERSLRRYGTMLRPHPDEIRGIEKVWRIGLGWPRRKTVVIQKGQRREPTASSGLTIVATPNHGFTFSGLHQHRDTIRARLLKILASPPSMMPVWGAADYAGVHIRLGDFRPLQSDSLWHCFRDGERIPLIWYERALRRVREVHPDLPVRVFSDGDETELASILAIEGVSLLRGATDVDDLLALAQARLLVGSNSTFSRWAAFLGNMPSIWPNTSLREQPTNYETPIIYVADDFEAIR